MTGVPRDSHFRLAPLPIMAAAVALGVAVVTVVTLLAHQRPWLGVELEGTPDGVRVMAVSAKGPSAEIPRGTVLASVEGAADQLDLTAFDLTTEPDGAMGDYATYRKFLERQTRLARIQGSAEVVFTAVDGERFVVSPALAGRPPRDFPADFWVQCFVGLAAWLVSAAVFTFRPRESAARYLLLSGAATLMFAPAAAVYTTRELAVDGTLLRWASDLNFFGGSLFAASFVALLLVYPRRIAPRWTGPAVVALYAVWFVAQQVGVFESMTFARRFLVMMGVLATLVLAGVHWFGTRRDPVGRAALQWFLLSWMLGTCLFALFILLPQVFGIDTSPIQGYAFSLFLLVYGGLAFGILRYRLFELGNWWRRIAVWTLAVLLLILLDMAFLLGLHLSTGVSLSLALLICGLVWLPLRAWVWGRFAGRGRLRSEDLYGRIMEVSLAPAADGDQETCWRKLVGEIFDPLEITPAEVRVSEPSVGRDGLELTLPGVGAIRALRMGFAGGGGRLFTPRDVSLAAELVRMLGHAIGSRKEYEKGAAEERARIARDMHDNIGAQLLAALHSADPARKDATIRETLADLRDMINNTSADDLTFDETLAELRVETADRLAAAGISLRWTGQAGEVPGLTPVATHALRSIVREAVSNVIKHADARQVRLSVQLEQDSVALEIADDGKGFDTASVNGGNGLTNIRDRLDRLRGTLRIIHNGAGTSLAAQFPIPDRKP